MKKILISLAIIGVVAVVVAGVTTAFFSDEEKSTGNTFTAGSIDLKVDSEQHYNGNVCVPAPTGGQGYVWTGNAPYPIPGTPCGGTWGQPEGKDIVGEKFFDLADVKPGDSGENTISLHVINNDAWVCAEVSHLTDLENGLTEPEALVDLTPNVGELSSKLEMTVWRDDGDNILNHGEVALVSGHPINGFLPVYDSTTGAPLTGGSTGYLGVSWSLPIGTGNEVQTDSMTGDIGFTVVQARNNSGFVCGGFNPNPQPPTEPVGLSTAGNFVILSKSGITDIPTSAITGNVGTSPITGAAIGVSCTEVTGTIYDWNAAYTGGFDSNTTCLVTNASLLTTAVNDMVTAYNNAAGMTNPTATNLYGGNLGGQTFAPGLYKWTTGVTIPTNVTLSGSASDVWVFQIAGDLNIASGGSVPTGVHVKLTGGALASNVIWQVGGGAGAILGTYSTFNGTILSATQVVMQTGAVLNGRAFAQTQVTLDANTVVQQ